MRIITISTGKIQKISISGNGPARTVKSAINKHPVSTLDNPDPKYVGAMGVEQDQQADLNVHGGANKAVYAYPAEHYSFWESLLTEHKSDLVPLAHGFFGENLTVEGFREQEVFIGDMWTIGEVELMVEALREPCFKFNSKINLEEAGPIMVRSTRSGWYLSVLQSGILKAGDDVLVTPGDREISISDQNARLKIQRKL